MSYQSKEMKRQEVLDKLEALTTRVEGVEQWAEKVAMEAAKRMDEERQRQLDSEEMEKEKHRLFVREMEDVRNFRPESLAVMRFQNWIIAISAFVLTLVLLLK